MAQTTAAKLTGSPKLLALGLLESVVVVWALCSKHAIIVSRKLLAKSTGAKVAPKMLLAKISSKGISFRRKKRDATSPAEEEEELELDADFGGGGLWQRTILMGDKCEPLNFSGVIYYDEDGKRLREFPARSPRASPLPSYLFSAAKPE